MRDLSSVFRALDLGKPKPTTVSLQLADRSIKYLMGIMENMLVQVDKVYFPTDFIVLDMKEDRNVPLIWGRLFLAMRRALIDMEKGKPSFEYKMSKLLSIFLEQ